MKAISRASGALDALAALLPDSAEIMTEKGVEKIPVAQLRVGDVVLVRPGARVPADGIVTEGTADVDESMITGESRGFPKSRETLSSQGQWRRAEVSEFAYLPLASRRLFRESCEWLQPRRLLDLARRLWQIVQPPFCFMSPWAPVC
jgi:magnesium-transporting ATPase (P-type)